MKGSSFDRRRKVKLMMGVVAVGILVSALLGFALVLINGRAPGH